MAKNAKTITIPQSSGLWGDTVDRGVKRAESVCFVEKYRVNSLICDT